MDTIDYFRRVIEASGYPPELCFAHCLRACSSWRVYRECLTMSTPLRLTSTLATFTSSTVSFPFDLVAPFFCHAFGGTTFRDWCIAEVPGVFTSDQMTKHWLLAWLLVYFSPGDIAFRLLEDRRSPLRAITLVYEAIDAATTISGSVEKGIARFPQSTAAPLLLGLIAGVGGSVWRWLEKRGRYHDITTELAEPTRTFRQTLAYVFAHLWIRSRSGPRKARLIVATFHVLWTAMEEVTAMRLDWTDQLARNITTALRLALPQI
eukprot:m.12846 g.12846  ORF g.12846 m.12846 type:complete len:263 (-) comp7905_c0_seq2:1125-1913(-)